MTQMNNRKMPTRGAARGYMAFASILSLLYGLQPTGIFFLGLAICCLAVGTLSVPRASYVRVLLYSLAAGALPAVIVGFLRSPAYAVAAFAFAPAAALLVLTVRRRNSRSAGIFWAFVAITVTLVGAMLLWLWMRAGSLSFSVFKQLYTEIKTIFVDYMTPLLQENAEAFFMSGIDPENAPGVFFDTMLTILPGAFLMLMWLIAWLATACLRRVFLGYVYGYDRFNVWPVTVWRPLSFVYLGSFLLTLLPIDHIVFTVIATVCNNLFFLLLPIFTIVGCRKMKERLMRQPGCGCATVGMLVVLLLTTAIIPLFLLSVVGAAQTAFPTKAPQAPPPDFYSDNSPSDSDDDDDPNDQEGTSE
ncbi:MAG: hypothetical protein IJW62_00255 [Clostridia bacterium]|nr:hypothetical protein [Clostridia bacterium]